MSHINKKVPKRRFQEFNNAVAWEQRKLGELAEIVRGASPRPIQDPKWFDNNSEVGWLRISDVTAQNGRINYLEQRISEAGQEKTRVLKEPHLLLSIAATVGKPVINYVKTGVHDGFLIFLDIKFEQEFLFQWLEMFRTSWQKYGQPGSQVNLNSELVRNQEILIPSMKEQIKISQLFQQLDNTIALHQRKLEKIKALKTAYLSEMFPAEGETKPKRRFAGFTDDWEQHKLGDLIDKQIKGKAQLEKLSKGTVAYLDTFTLNGGKAFLTDGHEDVVETDILILWDGSKAGTVYIGFKGALGSTLKGYRTSINEQFVYQFLKYNQENIYNNYRTPNIPHVQKDFLDVFKISIPKTVEQAKLGSFFQQLDKTITIHQRKLQKLQNIKKAYLNEMFI
ncbi:specificity determinant HsdS [Listeria marthii FSL S4-120]|uniref:Specificity determinant HsdS n=1 Tax=Listeria marthii FSL S4-120 TaxID=702457 RepID=A0ABP2K339_9LIST|nr:specificity determinant HsdS [Listeria marthii FSL S4-120]